MGLSVMRFDPGAGVAVGVGAEVGVAVATGAGVGVGVAPAVGVLVGEVVGVEVTTAPRGVSTVCGPEHAVATVAQSTRAADGTARFKM